MGSHNVHEAKSNLSRLLQKVAAGEEVIIMRDGEILSDEPNLKRHLATDELALLNQRERRVKLA